MEGVLTVYLVVSYVVMAFAMAALLAICLFNDERQKEAERKEIAVFTAGFIFVWLCFSWLFFPIFLCVLAYLLIEKRRGQENVSTSPLRPVA